MNTGILTKQMISFQKSAFNHTFDLLLAFKNQSENIANNWCEKNGIVPEQGRTFMLDWSRMIEKGLEEYKKIVNESFTSMESYVDFSTTATRPGENAPPTEIVSTNEMTDQNQEPGNQ